MALNLVQHRGDENVWDRVVTSDWDTERWLAACAAGVLLAAGLRRRSVAGLVSVAAGGVLLWWAAAGAGERQVRRARLHAALPSRTRGLADPVTEAAEESFPASDAPSWTPTTGRAPAVECPPEIG